METTLLRDYFHGLATDRQEGFFAGFLRVFLWLGARFYGAAASIACRAYAGGIIKQQVLPRPVISVGNVTWGGTGKTPFVAMLAGRLRSEGMQPAILMRGYMPSEAGSGSDEAAEQRQMLAGVPIGTGRNRRKSAAGILREHSVDVFLLDDGFQHWRLKRNCDIVLVDATNPFGNGELIPRGILREPISALGRADVVVITKSDLGANNVSLIRETLQKLTDADVFEAVHAPAGLVDLCTGEKIELATLRDKAVGDFCSIADPKGFEKTLTSLGARLKVSYPFADHHRYTRRDVEDLMASFKHTGVSTVVTTAKDAVKLADFIDIFENNLQCWVLQITTELTHGQENFYNRIHHLLHR